MRENSLYDPSGILDSTTGCPIANATLLLQALVGDRWVDADPKADPPVISPRINPITSMTDGRYAWDTIPGTYRVVVSAPGYVTQISRVVTVPPEVLDLDIYLVPDGPVTICESLQAPAPPDTGTGFGAVDARGALGILAGLAALPALYVVGRRNRKGTNA